MTEFTFQTEPPPSVTAFWNARSARVRRSFDHRDVWQSQHVDAFTVAKGISSDVLNDIREEVAKALAEGKPFEAFAKDLQPRLEARGWWGKKDLVDPKTRQPVRAELGSPRRLKTIYWANIRTARAGGLWRRAQATKEALPFFRYSLGPSENHRPHHESKAGLTLPVDDPFWDNWFPPNGWLCKCWVRQITRAEADRLGGQRVAPEIDDVTHINERLPEGHPQRVTTVPRGIDPGWAGNAGKDQDRALRATVHKLDRLPLAERSAVIRAGSGAVQGLISLSERHTHRDRSPDGLAFGHRATPVAAVDDELVGWLAAKTSVVSLSVDDLAKQRTKVKAGEQRPLDAGPYLRIDELVGRGEIFRTRDGDIVVSAALDGEPWVVVLRKTRAGDAIFVKSFRRTNGHQLAKMRRQLERLRGASGGGA